MKKIVIHGSHLKVTKEIDQHAPSDRFYTVIVEGEMRSPSDGYHTFEELYRQRNSLYVALCKSLTEGIAKTYHKVWCTKVHSDGSTMDGWFLLGIDELEGRQITYHLPNLYWDEVCNFADILLEAPKFDGHSSQDVLERIKKI